MDPSELDFDPLESPDDWLDEELLLDEEEDEDDEDDELDGDGMDGDGMEDFVVIDWQAASSNRAARITVCFIQRIMAVPPPG